MLYFVIIIIKYTFDNYINFIKYIYLYIYEINFQYEKNYFRQVK